jgi:hypothetical protein
MSLKKLLQLLAEAPPPLPHPELADFLEPAPGNYHDDDLIKTKSGISLENILGLPIGKGSSRVVFNLNVGSDLFPSADLSVIRSLGINESKIETALKVAINAKGIYQNKEEYSLYKKYPSPLVTPVLDSSYRERQARLKINGKEIPQSESNWIQTVRIKSLSKADPRFPALLTDFFGAYPEIIRKAFNTDVKRFDLALNRGNVQGIRDSLGLMASLVDPANQTDFKTPKSSKSSKNPKTTAVQHTNLLELIKLIDVYQLIPADLSVAENWGLLDGRLFLLDWGFTSRTQKLYYGSLEDEAHAFVDQDGNINIIT